MNASSRIYDSFEMYDAHGNFVCYCSFQKAKSYVMKKELANWMDNNGNLIAKDKVFIKNRQVFLNGENNEIKRFQLSQELPKLKELQLQAKTNKCNTNSTIDSIDDYHKQKIENKCVCCGQSTNLTRHHVVPYMYRKNFHNKFKDHSHHDVLPVCYECHRKYELEADNYKLELAYQYGVPINIESMSYKSKQELDNERILKARYIIQQFFDEDNHVNLPSEKLEELSKLAIQRPVVLNPNTDDSMEKYRLPRKTIGSLVVRKASKISYIVNEFRRKYPNTIRKKGKGESLPKYMDYLENLMMISNQNISNIILNEVVLKVENELYQFVFNWRKHFIDTMQPKYMPEKWNIYKKYL